MAWLAAWMIVTALFLAFGRQLQRLPLLARGLVISGVLVITMTQLVVPVISRFLQRHRL
jgi:antibiotic biosynthesis monooxygenase (ABM) superfamily enzyme